MSVKPPSSLIERLLGLMLADWWIDVILMLFIVGMMIHWHE